MPEGCFEKWNRSGYADALICEAEGLAALAQAAHGSEIAVPQVFSVDERCLRMTAIAATSGSASQFAALGRGLAHIHQQPQSGYGWHRDNYIGLNPQLNQLSDNWGEFFCRYRLGYQISIIDNRQRKQQFRQRLEAVWNKVVAFLNSHCSQASLVHGDLWSGNYLCDPRAGVWLIDPAVYRGDREVDLAMSEMFGAFPESFYRAYDAALPRSAAYPLKRPIYNFYHYLNHYNLFGETYLGGCEVGLAALESL